MSGLSRIVVILSVLTGVLYVVLLYRSGVTDEGTLLQKGLTCVAMTAAFITSFFVIVIMAFVDDVWVLSSVEQFRMVLAIGGFAGILPASLYLWTDVLKPLVLKIFGL
jgi:hypothetical protein